MTITRRWILLALAIAGVGICLTGVMAFLIDMLNNNLPWDPEQTAREHYLAVGHSYSQGFAMGFFFCFFLALVAVGIGAGARQQAAPDLRTAERSD